MEKKLFFVLSLLTFFFYSASAQWTEPDANTVSTTDQVNIAGPGSNSMIFGTGSATNTDAIAYYAQSANKGAAFDFYPNGTGNRAVISLMANSGTPGVTSPNSRLRFRVQGDEQRAYIEINSFAGHLGSPTNTLNDLVFNAKDQSNQLFIASNGNIGVGTDNPMSKLAIEGQVRSTEVKVLSDIAAPDYVFKSDYNLRSLDEVEAYINENSHLPEIPSAAEFAENGIDLGKMSFDLLKKVEELTLYMIDLKNENGELKARVKELEKTK